MKQIKEEEKRQREQKKKEALQRVQHSIDEQRVKA